MSMVSHCEEHAAVTKIDDKNRVLYEGAKAELLYYARLMLDKVGVEAGWITQSMHSTQQVAASGGVNEQLLQKITNEELKTALGLESSFDDAYLVRFDLKRVTLILSG